MIAVTALVLSAQVQLWGVLKLEDTDGSGPISQLWVMIGKNKTRIADVRSNAGDPMQAADLKSNKFPKEALTGFRSWWAGGGDDYYLAKRGSGFQVMTRFVQEDKPSFGKWEVFLDLDSSGKPKTPYLPEHLSGKYKAKSGETIEISHKLWTVKSPLGSGDLYVTSLKKGEFWVAKSKASTEIYRLQFMGSGKSMTAKVTLPDGKTTVFTRSK